MSLIALIVIVLYILLIGSLIVGFVKVKVFSFESLTPEIKFSIVIPFRNEAKNLETLLDSIDTLNYSRSHFEIIFIDDESTDTSVKIIEQYIASVQNLSIRIISNERLSNSPKKDAITTAIAQAKHDWIITTDADCSLPVYWLDSYNQYIIKTNKQLVCGPVNYTHVSSLLSGFQLLDLYSLLGATIGSFGLNTPFLCNGANLAYHKALFKTLNGFDHNNTIASGDDVFLLQKALQYNPNIVGYLKSNQALVTTKPEPTLKALIAQRKRWASKTNAYSSIFGKFTAILILFTNAFLISIIPLFFIDVITLPLVLFFIFMKFGIDMLLISRTAQFFNDKRYLNYLLLSSFIYPFFCVFIAVSSTFSGYKWKNRQFNK